LNTAGLKTDYDGVERISTQDLFDILEVPQRARSAGACRRLAVLMRKFGWTPIKASYARTSAPRARWLRPAANPLYHITITLTRFCLTSSAQGEWRAMVTWCGAGPSRLSGAGGV